MSEKRAVVRGVISMGRERKGNEGENEGDGLVGKRRVLTATSTCVPIG